MMKRWRSSRLNRLGVPLKKGKYAGAMVEILSL